MAKISREAYANMFGPTVGDRVRLGDTELWIEVEQDYTVYGDEVKFGGGKVIRDGMGQSQAGDADVVDLVITNALILDHWGIVKADVGVNEGKIVAIGKAGNPDTQEGVTIEVGPGTEVLELVRREDALRISAIGEMFVRFGFDEDEALVRARVLYFAQVGYHAMNVGDSMSERLNMLEHYYLSFTGQTLDPESATAFRHKMGSINDQA